MRPMSLRFDCSDGVQSPVLSQPLTMPSEGLANATNGIVTLGTTSRHDGMGTHLGVMVSLYP